MPLKLNYETPQPRRKVLFEPPRSLLWCSVMVGLGLIAPMCVPKLVSHGPEAKIAAAQNDIMTLSTAIYAFDEDLGRFPTTSEGLDALFTKPSDSTANWHGPYLQSRLLHDPVGPSVRLPTASDDRRLGFRRDLVRTG